MRKSKSCLEATDVGFDERCGREKNIFQTKPHSIKLVSNEQR